MHMFHLHAYMAEMCRSPKSASFDACGGLDLFGMAEELFILQPNYGSINFCLRSAACLIRFCSWKQAGHMFCTMPYLRMSMCFHVFVNTTYCFVLFFLNLFHSFVLLCYCVVVEHIIYYMLYEIHYSCYLFSIPNIVLYVLY